LNHPDIGSGSGVISEEVRRLTEQARAERERRKQALNLQRSNILSQKTSNPSRRAALMAALEQIEGEIQAIH
jgi:precorrin-6B methylase 2